MIIYPTIRKYAILSFLVLVLFSLGHKESLSQFGQNKVQYKEFNWFFIQSKHFDIYFNQGGDYIAQFTALAAESSLVALENNIKYKIQNRIPIIVFNSHNEFQQNNAVDEYLPEGVGGVTELFKNRIVVPFEGDYKSFRHVIHHELLHAYMNDMYYGGSIQNIITQNIKLQFPHWFSEGMAEYQSIGGMDKQNDMFMRDAIVYNYLPESINYIGGYLSYRGGQSFFSWLSEEYGKEKIGDLMQQIKALSDVDEGFKDVYKMDTEELSKKWIKYLKQTYWPDYSSRKEVLDFANRITNHEDDGGFYNTAPAISPKGDKIAFISNRDDYFDVFIADVRSGRISKKIIEGSRTADFEELHLLTPGLSWSPNSRQIAISVKAGSKDAIYLIDVESEDGRELPIKFEGIFSVNWSPSGNKIAFVGNTSKQSDIMVYDLISRKLESVTNDIYSDHQPTWSHDGSKIYFSSDRKLTSTPGEIIENAGIENNYDYSESDLYVYDVSTKKIERLSGEKFSEEKNVVTSPDGKFILYISDRNGINNIWKKDILSGTESPITNSISPIEMISLSADGKRLAFSSLYKGGYDLFYIDNPFDINLEMAELPLTTFAQKELADFQQKDIKEEKNITGTDTTLNLNQISDTAVSSVPDTNLVEKPELNNELRDTILARNFSDTNLYGDIAINLRISEDSLNNPKNPPVKLKESSKFRIKGNVNEDGSFRINKYKIKFSPDIIYSNVNYSTFYGVQGIAQMSFSDMLGNHRILVLTSLVLDLKNSDYAFGYYYLPKRLDLGFEGFHSARFLTLNRQVAQNTYIQELFRYRTFGLNVNASYPFNKFDRVDGALQLIRLTKENLDNPEDPETSLNYALPVVSYVHDNTIFGMTAPIRGTRYNLTFLGTPKIGANGVSFFSSIADFRTYFKIADDYNLAWRLSGGFSVGKNPQRFYIGGTENWINYELENVQYPVEELQDFAFATPVLPLRGFPYDYRAGSKYLLMNTEFRFPLFRYLVLGALPLAFQNIQGVLFTDIGTIWNSNRQLKLFEEVDGQLRTKDLLIGMGFGARLFFLYFPLKFDVAWSYNIDKFSKPKYYISIGADF